jgi:transposase
VAWQLDDDEGLQPIRKGVAGIDIAAKEHFVAGPKCRSREHVRSFKAETDGLISMDAFLREQGTRIVAMEATGVYSMAVFNFFEDLGYQCILLDPRSVRMVPDRKTDVSDCMWIRRILACGLPSECFVPTKEFSALRAR